MEQLKKTRSNVDAIYLYLVINPEKVDPETKEPFKIFEQISEL